MAPDSQSARPYEPAFPWENAVRSLAPQTLWPVATQTPRQSQFSWPASGKVILLGLVSILSLNSHAASPREAMLYSFIDGDGVAHFSDQPSDPRHRPVAGMEEKPPLTNNDAPRRIARSAPAAISKLIKDAAAQTDLDPALIEAVVHVESGFDPAARSSRGALGLMQIMPATADRYGVLNPFDPRQNLSGGSRYLRDLLARFKDLPLALAAYNAGESALERHGNTIPPFPETQRYVPAVLDHYERLRQGPPVQSITSKVRDPRKSRTLRIVD